MMYTIITATVFTLLSLLAVFLRHRRIRKETERRIGKKWEAIQRDVRSLYFMLHYTVKQLDRMHDNPAMVDLSIDLEKLERPMDHRRLYAVMVQLKEDMERLKEVSAEYGLQINADVIGMLSRLILELEEFMRITSEYEHFRKVFRW